MRVATVGAGLLVLLMTGCFDAGAFIFRFDSAYDAALDVRTDGPMLDRGAPAADGYLNVFLFTAESIADWEDSWGLFDPPRPPTVPRGSTIEVAAGEHFRLELDDGGRAAVHFQQNADLVMAIWLGGTPPDLPRSACPEHFPSYATPDEPFLVSTLNATDEPVTVPFGLQC